MQQKFVTIRREEINLKIQLSTCKNLEQVLISQKALLEPGNTFPMALKRKSWSLLLGQLLETLVMIITCTTGFTLLPYV